MKSAVRIILVLCVAVFWPARGGAAWLEQFACQSKKHNIVVDGKDSDWKSASMSEHSKLKVACVNDRSYLYMYVSPSDKATQDQLTGKYGQTFTLWLGTAAPTQSLGLRFSFNPPAAQKGAWSGGGSGLPGNFVAQQGNGYASNPWGGGMEKLDAAKLVRGIDILSAGRDGQPRDPAPLTRSSSSGIQAKMGNRQGGVFYELRIPLLLVYGVVNKPPRSIAIGLETSAASTAASRAPTGPGQDVYTAATGTGVSAGGRRGRRGGGSGGRGSGNPSAPQALHIWLSASLSSSAPK